LIRGEQPEIRIYFDHGAMRGDTPSHRTSGASEVNKVILYYKFVPVADPAMTMRWQKEVCGRLGLKGRIIVSKHGINGTLGGDIENLREYKREMNRSITFKGITYKWSDGTGSDFPGSVKKFETN
jgi:predicted sulfurtransferase